MKKKKMIIISILLTALMTYMPIPTLINNITVAEAATVKLNKSELELYIDEAFTLKVSGTKSKPKWSSSKKTIAKVSSTGKVTGLKEGTAVITATIGSKKYKCNVKVKDLSISSENLNLQVAETSKLSLIGATKTVTWKSSDKDILSVNKDGFVYANNEGTATITGTHRGRRYTCEVQVKNNLINSCIRDIICSRDTDIMITIRNLPEGASIHSTVADSDILECEFGEWSGETIPISIKVLKKGITTITIKADGIDEELIITVMVIDDKRPKSDKLDAEDVYDKCSSATVEIETNERIGSGFFIDSGVVVTNYHLIEGQSSIEIKLQNGEKYDAKFIIGYNKALDIALLSIPVETESLWPNLYSTKVGENVYAIGSPFGLTDTFTNGIVSSVSRHSDGVEYIQTNAAITNGNSGGPLINAYGEVIGINTFTIGSGQNHNFAIDINQLYMVDTAVPVTVKEYYDKYIEDNRVEFTDVIEDIYLSGDPATCQLLEQYTSVEGSISPKIPDFYKVILPEDTFMTIFGYSMTDYETKYLMIGVLDSNLYVLYSSEGYYSEKYFYQAIAQDFTAGTYYIVVLTDEYYTRSMDYSFYMAY
ncbi:MAG: trypsin-like serine protease [Anaerolineaceae bacterium]|nr:MAG: trypsin-like serine protease [Anaerolineaceae bacterium]